MPTSAGTRLPKLMGRKLALLIATHNYQDEGLRRLKAPAADAKALAAVLRDPAIAGFDVTTLINEPHYVVGEAIGDFCRGHRHDDLTLLYFTGHGLKDDDGRLYLAMNNTRRNSLLFTSLPAEQLDQAMQASRSRRMVLILDCCYSGAFRAGVTAKADDRVHSLETFQGRGRTVLTASDAMQYSFEEDQLHGAETQSVFTRCLVEGLRDGSADLDRDGNITLDELYTYVHDRVIDEMPQQRPKKQDNVEGRTIIARNINWRLPDHLRQALDSPIAAERLAALDGLAHLYRVGNDLVLGCVRDEMHRLAEDDSRTVSTAAAARLHSFEPPRRAEEDARAGTEEQARAREAVEQARRQAERDPTLIPPTALSTTPPPGRTQVSPALVIVISVGLAVMLGWALATRPASGGLTTPANPAPHPTPPQCWAPLSSWARRRLSRSTSTRISSAHTAAAPVQQWRSIDSGDHQRQGPGALPPCRIPRR
jgi:Caspase domain